MRSLRHLFTVSLLLLLVSCLSPSNQTKDAYDPPPSFDEDSAPPAILRQFNQTIQKRLSDIVSKMESESKTFEGKKVDEQIIRGSLSKIASFPGVMDCAYINEKGVMTYIEPLVFTKYENQSITEEQTYQRMIKEMRPVLGGTMLIEERYYALFLQRPFSGSAFSGGLSAMIRPENFFDPIVEKVSGGIPVNLWVLTSDGTIVYQPDHDAIGRNLLEGLVYNSLPDLQRAVKQMLKTPSGATCYTLSGAGYPDPKRKVAYWTQASYYGQDWTLVMTQDLIKMSPKRSTSEELREGLSDLAETSTVTQAVENMNQEKMMSTLKSFWLKNPCYSVQWVSPRGVVLGGYPPENSLKDHTMDENLEITRQFQRALSSKKPTTYKGELLEGGLAEFILMPIFSHKNYVGTIYAVKKIKN